MKTKPDIALTDLRNQDSNAFALLYTFYYPMVERFVQQNNGTRDDAQDVFQETILVLLEKVPTDDFTLTSSLKTYVFAVASNLWLKRLRAARRLVRADASTAGPGYEIQPEVAPPPTLRERLTGWLLLIPRHCQRLLWTLYFLNKSMDAVRQEHGYRTLHSAQNQKYKCLEKLRKQATTSDYSPECD